MPKKKAKIQESGNTYSKTILTEIVRYSNPVIVKAVYFIGMNRVDAHGQGDNLQAAEDEAIKRVKELMKNTYEQV